MKTPSEFIQEWIETVCSNDPSKIANLYQEDAILLGTLDKSVREGRNKIREYFDFFVKLKPCGEITELVEKNYGNGRFCVVNGTYDFNLEEDGKQSVAPARFTFVLERTGVKWMIQSHHSSKQP